MSNRKKKLKFYNNLKNSNKLEVKIKMFFFVNSFISYSTMKVNMPIYIVLNNGNKFESGV